MLILPLQNVKLSLMKKLYTLLFAFVAFMSVPAVAQFSMANYTITPGSYEHLTEIETVTIHWSGLADGFDAHISPSNVGQYVTITADGATYKAKAMYAGVAPAPSVDDLVLVFDKITAPGTYTLKVPEGIVMDYDQQQSADEGESYSTNAPITATYIIDDTTPKTPMSDYTLDPVSGSTVKSIKKIIVTFPQTAEREGLDEYGNPDKNVTLVCGEDVYHPSTSYPGEYDYCAAVLDFGEITEPGTYTLTIPAEMFKEFDAYVDDPATQTNPEIIATYTISGNSGISVVEADAADKVTVVDLMGRIVVKDASRTSLDSLEAGFYIVNGKKTLLRK